jgi:hypothetical protein
MSANAIKVLLSYESESSESQNTSLSVKLPKSWSSQPVSKLLDLFIETFNKKFTTSHTSNDFHLISAEGLALCSALDISQEHLRSGDVVRVAKGKGPEKASNKPQWYIDLSNSAANTATVGGASTDTSSVAANPLDLQCRNYGCTQKFREAENNDSACRHHALPPLFHDTKKGWGCCKDKMAYDWDDFAKIAGCVVSRHSTIAPVQTFAKSPSALTAEAEEQQKVAKALSSAKSIDSYNVANPNAVTAASSAAKTVTTAPKQKKRQEDARLYCHNKGCGKWFLPGSSDEDAESSCFFHPSNPMFHDASKKWPCCNKTAFEFEDFVKLPGCAKGKHYPGEL